MTEVVRVELGSSILEGERIVQEALAAGLKVQLLRGEHPETGGSFALGTCSLLVSAESETDLRDLLVDFGY